MDLADRKTGKAAQESFPDEISVAPDLLEPRVHPLLAEAGPSSWGSWATATARDAVDRLARQLDVIYVHVDVDILDATEIPGSFYEAPGGPTADQVARVLEELTTNAKVSALGISSFPTAERGREVSLASAETLVRGALAGLKAR